METGIHVGNTPETISATAEIIVDLIKLFPEQSRTEIALIEGFKTIAAAVRINATVTGCTFYSGDNPDDE